MSMPTALAKVGDRIEHGQPIPGNVRVLRDYDGDLWWRNAIGHFHTNQHADPTTCSGCGGTVKHFTPLTVVEVDPEPQPADVEQCYECETTGQNCWAHRKADFYNGPEPDPSQPVVLRLPEVPEGAEALVGRKTGWRWLPYSEDGWQNGAGMGDADWAEGTFAEVLAIEHPDGVTLEFAPPREPRTWPKLDPTPSEVRTVQIIGGPNHAEVWRRDAGMSLFRPAGEPDGAALSLAELRELGDVREVIEP